MPKFIKDVMFFFNKFYLFSKIYIDMRFPSR